MASHGILLASLLVLSCFSQTSYGIVLFSSLKDSLLVTASHTENQVLKAGIDKLTVSWGLNQSYEAGTDSTFKTIKVNLCFAQVSQVDRGWRKTVDNLAKDKTCLVKIVERPYTSSKSNDSFDWIIERDVPGATYFVRAYAFDAADQQVAYGQTTDAKKTANLFVVEGITGRHLSLDITSVAFSAFSVLSLACFFIAEKRRAKSS
ncbi:hypothetical protein ACFX13_039572 [Malus domestica]|uniref:High-affinity nitrate transporter n=1 Tax=Malus domestica TaxID=3750 RepID=A0A498JKA9_MALDO|nr:hypothetical protein DVH24_008668 [Malus domestica]